MGGPAKSPTVSGHLLLPFFSFFFHLRDHRPPSSGAAMGEETGFVGARLDAGLRAARFSSPPSAEEFAADVEPKNVPAVILLPYVLHSY